MCLICDASPLNISYIMWQIGESDVTQVGRNSLEVGRPLADVHQVSGQKMLLAQLVLSDWMGLLMSLPFHSKNLF